MGCVCWACARALLLPCVLSLHAPWTCFARTCSVLACPCPGVHTRCLSGGRGEETERGGRSAGVGESGRLSGANAHRGQGCRAPHGAPTRARHQETARRNPHPHQRPAARSSVRPHHGPAVRATHARLCPVGRSVLASFRPYFPCCCLLLPAAVGSCRHSPFCVYYQPAPGRWSLSLSPLCPPSPFSSLVWLSFREASSFLFFL